MTLNIHDPEIKRKIGLLFWTPANICSLTITEQDVEYLQLIQKHPCFSVMKKYVYTSHFQAINFFINMIVFFEQFYYDPNCPQGVKNILFYLIGKARYNIKSLNMSGLLEWRYHYVEAWLNSIAEPNSP